MNVSVAVPIPDTGLFKPLVSVPAASASVPLATCSVTVMLSSWSAVGSVTFSRFVPLNATGFGEPVSFSAVVTVVGAVSAGVSATGLTLIVTLVVFDAVDVGSPGAVSVTVAENVSVSLPSNSTVGVYRSPASTVSTALCRP